MSKKTVIIGASVKPSRYAYLAAYKLKDHHHQIVPLSIHGGEVAETKIFNLSNTPKIGDVHTVTIYLNQANQAEWEDYILSLKPKRIIFNPGAENQSLATRAQEKGIETLNACTLVMLNTAQY